jgi:hypothetical protein
MIAAALQLDAQKLKATFIESVIELQEVEKFIHSLERLRVKAGDTDYVIMEISDLINELHVKSTVASGVDRQAIQRMQVKAQIVLVATYTTVLEGQQLRTQVATPLRDIRELGLLLTEQDRYYRGMATILPAMVSNLTGEYEIAVELLNKHWPEIEDPHIRAMCLRDQLVISARLKEWTRYKTAVQRTERALGDGSLTPAGQAKVLQGKAISALRLSLPNGENDLALATVKIEEAKMKGDQHCFTEAQIVRAKLNFALGSHKPDKEAILAMAQETAKLLQAKGYRRCLDELKTSLREARIEWNEFEAFRSAF